MRRQVLGLANLAFLVVCPVPEQETIGRSKSKNVWTCLALIQFCTTVAKYGRRESFEVRAFTK